jgi:hypothetical protein
MRLITTVGLFFSSLCFCNEVVWLKFTPQFSYKDISTSCTSDLFKSPRYLGLEIEGKTVVRASFRDGFTAGISTSVPFDSKEIKAIDIVKDKDGFWWVKSVALSRRMILFFK